MRPRLRHGASVVAAAVICAALVLCAGDIAAGRQVEAHPLPGRGGGANTSSSASTRASTKPLPSTSPAKAPTTTTTMPRLAGKVDVLEIGDSLGVDLGFGMDNALAGTSRVHLEVASVGDTGLSNAAYYNWPAHLHKELRIYHPQVLVVFIGGNDAQGFVYGGRTEVLGTAGWKAAYTARVNRVIDEATAAGARVLWVGMPIMQSPPFSAEMAGLDAIYRSAVRRHAGATYFSSWHLFSGAGGRYVGTRVAANGQILVLRDPDGVHLALDGCNLLGRAVVAELAKLYGIKVSSP